MQKLHTAFAIGEAVFVRGAAWRVVDARRFASCERLDLARLGLAVPGAGAPRTCALLHPFDRPARLAPAPPKVVPLAAAARALAAAAGSAHPWGTLARAAEAAIDLHPYQLEPALAVLCGRATRVLLADEVGLGKTIQAGLILGELRARGLARRALVLAPAGLRDQWAVELDRRFGLAARVMDAWRSARGTAPGVNPWELEGVVIASFDFVKRPEVLRGVEDLAWDVVIVDEAHAVAGASDRHVAVDGLCRRARRVVLLTATPHTGSDESFARLCRLGRVGAGDRLTLYRRTRAGLGFGRRRRVGLLRVRLPAAGRRMHRLLERYAREVRRERGATGEAALAMTVLRKRALSCASSLLVSTERRRRLLDAGGAAAETQLALPLDADLTREDEPPDVVLAAPGLADQHRERAWLDAIAAEARRAMRSERKLTVLARLIGRTREPAIVFTEYRDTLELVAAALEQVASVATLHGAMTRRERAASLAAFDTGRARVLVATDAAGQGLNLQARCRWVIDFELPWTHARLEQRIGRVDRLGQSRAVHALHLVARDTAEALVASRLVEHERRARSALGPAASPPPFPEDAMAELLQDRRAPRLAHAATHSVHHSVDHSVDHSVHHSVHHSVDHSVRHSVHHSVSRAAEAEARRLAWVRAVSRLAGRGARGPSDAEGVLVAALGRRHRGARRAAGATGVVFLYRAAIVDAAGRPVDTWLVPVLVRTAAGPSGRSKAAVLAWVRDVIERAGTEAADRTAAATAGRRAAIARRQRAAVATQAARERALATSLDVGVARSLVQAGLFDRRALRRAERTRRTARARRDESVDRLRALDDARRLRAAPPELLLAIACPEVDRLAAREAGPEVAGRP